MKENASMFDPTCPACRLRGRAGFLYVIVGAQKTPLADAPSGFSWPLICMSCGYEDDGNRMHQSPHHVPFPLPAVAEESSP
jgi:hypothetical protein